ncbi:MAG: hypothetical protein SGJ19_13420 [Planctomycetia bacterium]|nr:hypothetical protein [Planctomycetia bacterium]
MSRIGDETVHGFDHGRKSSVGTTAVQLSATSYRVAKGVQLKADAANSSTVYVGNADLTADTADATDGFPLAASEGLFVPVDDVNKIYVRGGASGQKVFWFAV